MDEIKQDIFNTNQSSINSVTNIGQQVKVDLDLKASINDLKGGSVIGVIKNTKGEIIKDAYVKLLSNTFEPLKHAVSNQEGNYALVAIAQGSYTIMVIAEGYKIKENKNIIFENGKTITMDFTLEEDTSQTLGNIIGGLFNFGSRDDISGAILSLYKINSNSSKELIALSYTNEYGQFSFRGIAQGSYLVIAEALGYKSTSIDVFIVRPGQIAPLNLYLIPSQNISRGTVSGTILNDANNTPINRADVILYKVEENNTLTPIAFTKTNENGVYLFINVPKGTYKIKSNEMEVTTVNLEQPETASPNFKDFSIESFGAYIPQEFYAKYGFLQNGAIINPVTGYVENLGGLDNGEVILSLPGIDSPYELSFEYLASDTRKVMMVSINDKIFNLTLPTTNSFDPKDSKFYALDVNLHPGMNNIKFFNDSGGLAPAINIVKLKRLPYTKQYLAKDGLLEFGAVVSEQTGFVTNIGPNDAYVLVNIFVPLGGKYDIRIQYLSPDADRTMSIIITDIYDNFQQQNFIFSKTNSSNIQDAKFYNITAILSGGNNDLYFYNDQKLLSPDINIIDVKEIFFQENYGIQDVQLMNGAQIENGLITNISSVGGYIILTSNVYGAGSYNLLLNYIAQSNNNKCFIDVNGQSTNKEYTFEDTGGIIKTKVVSLLLERGENKIKIYNK